MATVTLYATEDEERKLKLLAKKLGVTDLDALSQHLHKTALDNELKHLPDLRLVVTKPDRSLLIHLDEVNYQKAANIAVEQRSNVVSVTRAALQLFIAALLKRGGKS